MTNTLHNFEALERYWADCLADIAALEAALMINDAYIVTDHPIVDVISVIKNHTMQQVVSAIKAGMDHLSLAYSIREHNKLLQTLTSEPIIYTDFIAKSLHYLKYIQMFDQGQVAMTTDKIVRFDPLIRRYVDFKVASVDQNTSERVRTKLWQDWNLVLDEYVVAMITDDYHVTFDNKDVRILMRTSIINVINQWYESFPHQTLEMFRSGLVDCKNLFYEALPVVIELIIRAYREKNYGVGACKHLVQLLVLDARMGSNDANDWLTVQLIERFVQCDQRRLIQDMRLVCWQLSFCDDLQLLNQDQCMLLRDAIMNNVGILRFANPSQGAIHVQSKVFYNEAAFGINSLYQTVVHDAFYCFAFLLESVFHNRLTMDHWMYLLDVAVTYSSYRIIQRLAEVVIDADVQNDFDKQHVKDLLLRFVNRKTRNESTALLNKVIAHGGGVTARSQPLIGTTGCSLLVLACANGHDDYVRELLVAGADPYDYHIRTEAVTTTSGQLAQLTDRYSMAMTTVCIYGHSMCMQRLLEGGVDPNELLRGSSALYLCCSYGSTGCARTLIREGVDINAKGDFKRTPLLAACEMGHIDCCALLIHAGAKLDRRDDGGNTALMKACVKGHVACVRLLLEAGAEVNKRNAVGQSSLMQVCADTSLDLDIRNEIVSMLLAKGAHDSRAVGCLSLFFTRASAVAKANGYLSTAAMINNR